MKIEVHLQGGLRKIIDITPGATVGATVGVNLKNPDGSLWVPPSNAGQPPVSITSWELILNIPPNVTALSNTATTGLYVVTGAGTSETRSIQAAPGETTVSNGDGVSGNPSVGLADVADTGAGALHGITRDAKGRINGTTDATITGTAGQVDVANGDAAAGPPTISLADVADAGGGTFKLLTRDAKGRLSGTSDGDTDDVPEGAGNLYFTATRVRDTLLTGLSLASSAVISATDSVLSAFGKLQAQITGLASTVSSLITQTITNGDATHAPSGDAVFDALAGKEPTIAAGLAKQVWRGDKTWGDTVPGNFGASPAGAWSGPAFLFDGTAGGGFFVQDNIQGRVVVRTAGSQSQFIGMTHGGTIASPTATGNSVPLFELYGAGYGGATYGFNGLFSFVTTQAHTESARGTEARIATTDNGAVFPTNRWRWGNDGHYTPFSDNSYDVGSGSFRCRTIYAGTGSINTSDAREKTIRGPLTEQELNWARDLAALSVIYQWNEAVVLKGESARLHCSPTVQSVIASAEKHGLDPFLYGFVCYDRWDETQEVWNEWPAQEEVRDEEGNVVQPAREAGRELVQEYRPAGDRYSLRPSELQFFIALGQEERIRRLEALLNQ